MSAAVAENVQPNVWSHVVGRITPPQGSLSAPASLEIRSGVNSLSVSSSAKARPIPSDAPVTTTAGSYACQPSLIACPDFKGQDQTLRWSRTVITN